MFKKASVWLKANWPTLIAFTSIIAVALMLFLTRLGGHIRGDSPRESIRYLGINGLDNIISGIEFGPIKFLQLIAIKIDQPNATLTRLASVIFVLVGIIAFYKLIERWHTARIAWLSTFLFITSAYTLHLARYSLHEAMYLSVVPVLLLFGTWLKSKSQLRKIPIILPASSLLLYIPGSLIIIATLGFLFKRRLLLAWHYATKNTKIISSALSAVMLLPLFYSLANHPSQIMGILGLNNILDSGIRNVFERGVNLPKELFYSSDIESYRWLSGTPLFEVGTVVLVVLGVYAYLKSDHTLRIRLLAVLTVLTSVLYILGSSVDVALIVPIFYIFAANGIAFLLQSWFTVFPKNPAARRTGIITLVLFLCVISSYHLHKYFIAWPNNPNTQTDLIKKLD